MRAIPARAVAGILSLLLVGGVAHAEPIQIYAAGRLSGIMGELVSASGLAANAVAPPVFGPAGLLQQRIASGEHADLFASADMAAPQRLADAGLAGPVVAFARNRLCLVSRATLGITPDTMLDRMLDPKLRLATSTPGADPGGDYAAAVFVRADAVHPGARATLDGKAMHLFGGPTAMVATNGHTPGGAILLDDRADAVLYYCSSANDILHEVPGSVAIPLPPSLEVGPVNGVTVLGANPDAMRLALFMVSTPGQAILARHGLLPVLSEPAATPILTIVTASGRATTLSMAELRAMPTATLGLPGEHGTPMQLTGPALWPLLQRVGALDPDFHNHVRQVVIATGNDGYSVTVAVGEIDPEFEGKPVLIALTRDGAPLDGPRLAIPGDKRLGRDVRDVVSLMVR
jgi:molybdate transport system substrate-binding protein